MLVFHCTWQNVNINFLGCLYEDVEHSTFVDSFIQILTSTFSCNAGIVSHCHEMVKRELIKIHSVIFCRKIDIRLACISIKVN